MKNLMNSNPKQSFGFPFSVGLNGRINASGGSDAIRGKIIQVLFTSPGERVHQPEFGSGLFKMVFEPNNTVLVPAMEFTIGQAMTRWLGNEILVDLINVIPGEENVTVEIAYTKRTDLSKEAVRIQFR